MIRSLVAGSSALLVAGAVMSVPQASAAGGDQTIRVQNGQIRCLISADFEGRGRPATMCVRTDGAPFGTSPAPLNVAVVMGSGEMYFQKGGLPAPDGGDVVLGTGQTYTVNGWTVTTEELRTVITNDDGGHGIRINPVEVANVWI